MVLVHSEKNLGSIRIEKGIFTLIPVSISSQYDLNC